jgi:hypothetical protein
MTSGGKLWTMHPAMGRDWPLFDNSSSLQALTGAAKSANKLTVTETKTWLKLQKLSNTV